MLDGRGALAPGLGLGAFKLIRLFRLVSTPMEGLPMPGWKLLGLDGFRAGAGLAAGGWAMIVAMIGFTNMPYPMGQSKYLSP